MQRKKTRRVWSDKDKEALIRQFASYEGQGSLQERYDKLRISGSWFRTMRVQFLRDHPEIDFAVSAPGVPVVKMVNGWPTDPEERRQEMLRRRAKWDLNKSSTTKPASSRYPVVLDPAVASALKEYKGLSRFDKASWREARRLSPGQISHIIKGLATPNIIGRLLHVNGNQQMTVRDQRLARIVDPITVIPASPTPAPSPSLQDGVAYLEIKRDLYTEIIADLNRVLKGGR
jgi:hypothetical protein